MAADTGSAALADSDMKRLKPWNLLVASTVSPVATAPANTLIKEIGQEY